MFNPKQLISLGKTNLKVTRMGLGTGYLGGLTSAISEEHFRSTVEQAHHLGVRYFDTAPMYGLGMSEQRLGSFLSQLPRDSYVLSTKVGRLVRPPDFADPAAEIDHLYDTAWHGVPRNKLVVDYSYDGTMRCIEESLNRMGTGRIDIVYIHDAFTDEYYKAAINGAYRALDQLRAEHVITAMGVGIGMVNRLIDFAREGRFDCFLVAGRYTLLDQSALAELLPICETQGISVVLGSAFNGGLLADPYRPNPQFDYEPAVRTTILRARRMDDICKQHGIPLKAAALQFPAAHPAVAVIMTGATSPEEAVENARLVQLPIPAAFWSDLKRAGLLPEDAPTPPEDSASSRVS